ncbi:MAG TPA: hypothetical protein VK929_07920 [Longimicrobiales bacterium]|nr:hypothetical protein [Longimicrobiales bacterium]
MRRTVSTLGAVAVAAFAMGGAGCDSSTEPAEETLAVSLDFDVGRPAFMPAFSTSRDGSELLVRGRIDMHCDPSTASASAARDGDVLVLTIELEAVDDCMAQERTANYDATITGIARLTTFRIVHSWPGTGNADTVVYESVWD